MSNAEYCLPNGSMLLWYKIEDILGQGGFGITYLAHDTNLDHKVAIKEFFPFDIAERASDQTISHSSPDVYEWGLSHFISEARTLAKCDHPNIVSVNTVFESNNTAYIVMEYIHGQSLKGAIKSHWHPGEAELKDLMFALMDGLSQVHERGFIHRDIKPDNILLRQNRNPVLVDFGSARQSSTEMTSLVSRGYTPFEQYCDSGDNKQGPWTDIYSLGATTYTVITGKCPVDSVTRTGSLVKGAMDPLTPISQLGIKEYSATFLNAIDAALAVKPTDRPQTMEKWKALFSEPATQEIESADYAPTVVITDKKRADLEKQALKRNPDPSTQAVNRRSRPDDQVVNEKPVSHRHDSIEKAPEDRGKKAGFPIASKKWLSVGIGCLLIGVVAVVVNNGMLGRQNAEPSLDGTQAISNGQETIRNLLAAADQDLKVLPFNIADGRRAKKRFDDVLALAPNDSAATQGLARLFDRYVIIANEAVTSKTFVRAEDFLKDAESIFPGSAEVSQIRERLNSVKNQDTTVSNAVGAKSDPIPGLLTKAEDDIRAQRLVTPPENNALYRYKRVLDLDPGNESAKRGVTRIVNRYVGFADTAISEKQFDKARSYLKDAESGLPQADAILKQAHQRVSNAETLLSANLVDPNNERIRRLLDGAERDISALRLNSPPGNNAWEKYQQILTLRPNHALATKGGQRVVRTYRNIIDDALFRDNVTEAARHLKNAEDLLPLAYQRGVRQQIDQFKPKSTARPRPSGSTEIQQLLVSAENDIRASRLDSPPGQNAQDRYLRILELDPRNAEAAAGLDRIKKVREYLDLTERAMASNHFGRAQEYLKLADGILPGIDVISRTRVKLREAMAEDEYF